MALKPTSRQPIGKQAVTPRRQGKNPAPKAVPPASPAPPQPDASAQVPTPPGAPARSR